MAELDLSPLFSTEVAFSSGKITPLEVEMLSPLPAEELPKGFKGWAEKRKREFLCGRHHARVALECAGATNTIVLRAEDGVPLFPHGFNGSITHTGRSETFAAAAVAKTPIRIGLDAENQRPLSRDMMEMVLSADEISHLTCLKPANTLKKIHSLGDRALLAFSAKEAFYKCTYPKHKTFLGFHEVEFSLDENTETLFEGSAVVGSFTVKLLKSNLDGCPVSLKGRYLQLEERVHCAVEWSD